MINGLSIQKDATGVTIVGGTAMVLAADGLTVSNGIHVVDTSATNLTTIKHATFKNKAHALQPDKTFSKAVRNVNYTFPYALADGTISYQVFRGTLELHPEVPFSVVTEIRRTGAQLLVDSELDEFYNLGTVR